MIYLLFKNLQILADTEYYIFVNHVKILCILIKIHNAHKISLIAICWNLKGDFGCLLDIILSIWYSIMMLVKFADLSQSDRSNWVMWQVKDPCPRPGWDGCLTREKIAFIKSIKTWIILLFDCIFKIKMKKMKQIKNKQIKNMNSWIW